MPRNCGAVSRRWSGPASCVRVRAAVVREPRGVTLSEPAIGGLLCRGLLTPTSPKDSWLSGSDRDIVGSAVGG